MTQIGIPMPWKNKTKTEGTTLASNPQVRQIQIPYGQNVKTVTEPQTGNDRQIQAQNENNASMQQNSDRGATLQPIQAEMPYFKDAERKADGYITRSINRHNLPQSINRIINYADSNPSDDEWQQLRTNLGPINGSSVMEKITNNIPEGSIAVNIDKNQIYPGVYLSEKGVYYQSPNADMKTQLEELTHAAQNKFYGDKFDNINLANTEFEAKFIDDYAKYIGLSKEDKEIIANHLCLSPDARDNEVRDLINFFEKIYEQGCMKPEDIEEYHRIGKRMPQDKAYDNSSYDGTINPEFAIEVVYNKKEDK